MRCHKIDMLRVILYTFYIQPASKGFIGILKVYNSENSKQLAIFVDIFFSKMKKALIITYYWPPTGGSGVQRWLKFSKYLPEYGWKPVIYTPQNPERLVTDESLCDDILPGTEVIMTHITEPYGIYRRLTGGKGISKEVNIVSASSDKSLIQRISMKARGNLFVPDPRCLWIRPSVRFLKRYLEKHPADVIVTTGPPHSMHLIGKELKRLTGIPWVADFRDPWTEIFYFKYIPMCKAVRRKHIRLEKSVLDEADAVVAVSPVVRRDFMKKTGTPVTLITNGWDAEDFRGARPVSWPTFNIVHTGLFAADGNPENLWLSLKELCAEVPGFSERLRIRLAGKTDRQILDSINAAGLHADYLGYVPHEAAVSELFGASILILPLRNEPEYKAVLPGKLFEYLASGRPVIGIGSPDGAMAEMLETSGCGKAFGWDDTEKLKAEILRLWKQYEENGKTEETDRKAAMEYERSRLACRMAGLLEDIASKTQK